MNFCPTCSAASPTYPHGEGVPCPTRIEESRASVAEADARAALLVAQEDATRRAQETRGR